ncbi:MAG TPA: hypothetical protein VMV00_00380 [Candidatus Baltobacteraceae bacterium]|nr:hypothetical protein [Candidatus Baltobacteraceae bacterium]
MIGSNALWRLLAAAVVLAGMSTVASGQYWFQSGATGTYTSSQNQGASVSIQTVYQNVSLGSLGFWIGEDLSNGAFVQVGYEVTNSSGDFPTECTMAGCTGSTYIAQGTPTWFWEYFPPNYNGQDFLGGIGPNGSAGANGTYNTYSFSSAGNVWTAYFNNQSIGSADLGASASGANPPSALGEVAATNTNMQKVMIVAFKNLKFYDGSNFKYVPEANSYAGYGKGSSEALSNLYGVQEIGGIINYFAVGSGLSTQPGVKLWSLGYPLRLQSEYGNITNAFNYSAYSTARISAPYAVNTSNGTRQLFVGWSGSGPGSYTGAQRNSTVTMNGAISETALWQTQYYVGTSSQYGGVSGDGWHGANSTVSLSLNSSTINTGYGTRVVFDHWTGGSTASALQFKAVAPQNVIAYWNTQYLLNATTEYGNATGSGWYDSNSTADVRLSTTFVPEGNGTGLGFRQWSNGNSTTNLTISVSQPTSISAMFGQQYLVVPVARDAYGNPLVGGAYYNISGALVKSSGAYLFANRSYNIQYVYYKGTPVQANYAFAAGGSGPVYFNTQVYDTGVVTKSLIGTPVNATVSLRFKNGTTYSGHTGKNGTLSFSQVPYGYLNGTASYFGLSETVATSKGQSVSLSFLNPPVIAIVIAGILIIIASWRISLEIHRRKGLVM